jgi:hypothetical protein
LKKVFVDQTIPFAECRQKQWVGFFKHFHKCKFVLNCFNPCNPE